MARPSRKPSPRKRRFSASGCPRRKRRRRCRRSSRSASLISRAFKTGFLVRLLPALIAVDVGHYHEEPGVISASGRPEFEYNLELASEVRTNLQKGGFKVRMIGERGDYAVLHHRT